MANKVGPKSQVVIEKWIRDRLGIEPGWYAFQRIVDGHLEIEFLPPENNRSLAGSLAPYITRTISDDEWHDVKEQAWLAAARERVESWKEQEREQEREGAQKRGELDAQ